MSQAAALIEKRLQEYKAKPLLPLELTSIKRIFASSRCSVESFKGIYESDPVFCYMLISAATEATQTRPSSPFAADHAMSTIGIGRAQQLFNGLKPASQPALSNEVKFSLTSSLLAAELARQISELTSANNQAYWTALCYLLPDTLLWFLQPKHMWRIYYRQLTLPQRMTLFEESKLGFNLHDWRIAVAKTFHLSEQNQILFTKKLPNVRKELLQYALTGFSEKTPSLRDWHRTEGWLIVLSNLLARAILIPWHKSSFRHLFRLIHQLSGSDRKKLTRAINNAIRLVSENLVGTQLPIPAAGYLMNNSKPQFPRWLVNPVVKPPVGLKKRAQARAKNQTSLKTVIERLTNQADSFESSTTLVHFGLKALIDSLECDRVSFLTVDFNSRQVVTRIALTADGQTKIRPDFDYQKPTPLTKFIDNQAFMLFAHEQHQKVWTKVPQAVQQEQVKRFILCSLKPGDRVRAIIYADAKKPEVFSPQRIKIIKKLMQAVNKGLATRNINKKANGPVKNIQAQQ